MKQYKPLRWPRFWPFLRVVDELPATKRGRRKASNYGVSIVIRRDVLRDEPWVLQQEIYESRYWLRHPWRLVDFFWFYGGKWSERFAKVFLSHGKNSAFHEWEQRYYRAAAHLASVECQSRAQEIRARSTITMGHKDRIWYHAEARAYARSIHGASNYPFFAAAGWGEERVYQEIIANL